MAFVLIQGGSSWRWRRSQTRLWASILSCSLAVIFSISSTLLTLACKASEDGGGRCLQWKVIRHCAAVIMWQSNFLRGLGILSGERPSRKSFGVIGINTPKRRPSIWWVECHNGVIGGQFQNIWRRVPLSLWHCQQRLVLEG